MTDPKPIHVGWVFGLARSGSSITAYAAAAPWNLPVADEIMGPWDRTGEPYNYPPEQAKLVEMFKASHARLTPEIATLTRSLLTGLTEQSSSDRVVSKHPHLRFTPEEFAEFFPMDRGIWLIRNPLRRLASIHARGWTSIIRPNHDLDYFREYAEQAVRTLREEGHEAYYYHGPFRSIITIGVFTYDQAFVSAGNVDTYAPHIRDLQKVFPFNLGNGSTINQKENGKDIGEQKSSLIRVY